MKVFRYCYTAQIRHSCRGCGKRIHPGQKYIQVVGMPLTWMDVCLQCDNKLDVAFGTEKVIHEDIQDLGELLEIAERDAA